MSERGSESRLPRPDPPFSNLLTSPEAPSPPRPPGPSVCSVPHCPSLATLLGRGLPYHPHQLRATVKAAPRPSTWRRDLINTES